MDLRIISLSVCVFVTSAYSLLCTSLTKTIVNKLVKYWEQVRDVSSGRMNNAQKKEVLNSHLDKLLDLTRCRCTILTCPEATCMGCKYEAHITCNCPKEIKLPKTELRFIKNQRDKVGDLSSFQIITKCYQVK